MKRFGQCLEAAPVWIAYGLFGLLPLDMASWLGGRLGRWIGPRLQIDRDARQSLQATLGHPPADCRSIADAMWEQLGRTVAEFPHLGRPALGARIRLIGQEKLQRLQPPFLFVTAHLGNWEVLPQAAALLDIPFHTIYRPTRNPHVETLVRRARMKRTRGLHSKGNAGARAIHHAFRAGISLGLLADQKDNGGVPIEFLGREAMTGILPARLAIEYGVTIVPVRVLRKDGAFFDVEIGEPVYPSIATGDRRERIVYLLEAIHRTFGQWIAERPEQWFWVHHRWPRPDTRQKVPA